MMEKKTDLLYDVQEIYKKYGKFILKEIPKKTGVNWKIKKIAFRKWDKDSWSYKKSIILIGNYYKPYPKILASIIHEMIHMNTISKKNHKELSGSKDKASAREITTCILTNQIIRIINKKFNQKFERNNFDEFYKKYEKQYKRFEKLGKNKNYYDFFKLIKREVEI